MMQYSEILHEQRVLTALVWFLLLTRKLPLQSTLRYSEIAKFENRVYAT